MNPAPDGQRAYADLRNALANHLPYQLEVSRHSGIATLQLLAHRHKVRR